MTSNIWFAVRLWWWQLWDRSGDLAIVLVREGSEYRLTFGKFRNLVAKGLEFFYEGNLVYTMIDMPRHTFKSERFLAVVDGELVACPVEGKQIEIDMSLIHALVKGSLVTDAINSYHGEGTKLPMKWILVAVAVVVVLYVVYTYILGGKLPGQAGNVTVMPTPTPGWEPVSMLIQAVLNS